MVSGSLRKSVVLAHAVPWTVMARVVVVALGALRGLGPPGLASRCPRLASTRRFPQLASIRRFPHLASTR
eukprot:9466797-Pyramimonas_sp.AAC.1